MKHRKDLEISELRKQLDSESEARDKYESAKNELERDLAELKRNLEKEKILRAEAERSSRKADSNLQELKTRSGGVIRGASKELQKLLKNKKKFESDLKDLKNKLADTINQLQGLEGSQRRVGDSIDDLTQTRDELTNKVSQSDREVKSLSTRSSDLEKQVEEDSSQRTRLESAISNLESEIENFKDTLPAEALAELEDIIRQFELEVANASRTRDKSSSSRSHSEGELRTLFKQLEGINIELEEISKSKGNSERNKKKISI